MRQVVVITGASAGVGRATAGAFAKEGASIGLVARETDALYATAREVERLGGRAMVVAADVADAGAVQRAADEIEKALGAIDVWVNDAMTTVYAPIDEILRRNSTAPPRSPISATSTAPWPLCDA